MVEMIIVKIAKDGELKHELLKYLSFERRIRINNYLQTADKKRSLITELLIRRITCEKLDIPIEKIKISYNPYGKPYIDNIRHYKFNISHSENFVVMAVGKSKLGVDIEKMKQCDMSVGKKFFTSSEYNYIISQKNEQDRIEAFYTIWTLKESYVKAIGKGLGIPFNTFEFVIGREIILRKPKGGKKYQFMNRKIDDYMLSLCFMETDVNYQYVIMDESELYKSYEKREISERNVKRY
ncbi:MAG: phosphopantetheine-protein transferase [Anaerocolumna sp.]|jgi:4'-phosphopantetheinyl transferase|nr:phosphopantetheine-protein transferase [Anaerocolumna sp.]